MKFFRDLKLSTKILLGIVPLFILAVYLSVHLHNKFEEGEMMKQALVTAQTYSDIIRESLVNMMVTRQQVDENFLSRINELAEIDTLRLVLNDLRLRPSLMTPERSQNIKEKRETYAARDEMERSVVLTGVPMWERNGDAFRAIIPFKADSRCQRCHDVNVGYVLAASNIHFSLSRYSHSLEANVERTFWIFLAFTGLAIAIVASIFRRFVGRPVGSLMKVTEEIAKGNLSVVVQGVECNDELGKLGHAFDSMRIALKSNIEELERLNATLAVRNRQLEDLLEALRKAQAELISSERMATVGQMASSIIHDFKNPMSVIYTFAQILKKDGTRGAKLQKRALDNILTSVERMLDMTQELLDFSRGEMHLELSECNYDHFFSDVVDSVKMNLERNNIKMVVDQQFHGTLKMDIGRVRRALINIINNAQEAMADGGTLKLRTEQKNGQIRIEIEDTGPGIAEEVQGKIFEPFVTHGKSKGTGLGLAITKRIIDEHNGSIAVKSERGRGATFILLLPLRQRGGEQTSDD